jgi:hypothetical protein
MTIFLLIFSFILHGVTILLMLTLAKKVSVTESFDPERGEKVKQEMEDMLFAYTVQMKEENERLLKEIKQLKKRHIHLNKKQRVFGLKHLKISKQNHLYLLDPSS